MWATKHFGSMHHPLHDHSDSPLSGVYYVSIPKGSGAIEFRDPRFRGGDHNWAIFPKPGELIMFPGWLEHKVRPTFKEANDRDRISVAFNSAGNALATQQAFKFPPIDIATYADAQRKTTPHGKKLSQTRIQGSTESPKPNAFWKSGKVTSVRNFPYLATPKRRGKAEKGRKVGNDSDDGEENGGRGNDDDVEDEEEEDFEDEEEDEGDDFEDEEVEDDERGE